MLRSIIAIAVATAAITAAPVTPVEAQDIHPFDICVLNGTESCYPVGPWGPYLPTWGSPEEAEFQQCMASLEAACEAIHGRP